jgi:hypothetical protein
MDIKLTERMKGWMKLGCHLNVASKNGVPNVTVARTVKEIKDDEVIFAMTKPEFSVIESALNENPWVAFGVSKQGGIRACYQFKGKGTATPKGDTVLLSVKLEELYCTKPGYEAGLRLDVKDFDELLEWEKERWKDIPK